MPRGWLATTSAVRGRGEQVVVSRTSSKNHELSFSSSHQVRPANWQSQIFPRLFEVKQLIDMLPPCGKALAY